MRKVPRKVIPEGRQILRKVLAEGFCGRFRGRFWRKVPAEGFYDRYTRFTEGSRGRFLRKVPRKVFAEGSAEGSRKAFRGRLSSRSGAKK